MSMEENNNKLPSIIIDKNALRTKSETFIKSQNNILSYKLNKMSFNSTLKTMTLKKSSMNTSREHSKIKLRSTSTNKNQENKTNPLYKNISQNPLSSSQQINSVGKNYRSFYKHFKIQSKSKSII